MRSLPFSVIARHPLVEWVPDNAPQEPIRPDLFQLSVVATHNPSGEWLLTVTQHGKNVPWTGPRMLSVSDKEFLEMYHDGRWLLVTDIGPLRGHIEWHPRPNWVAVLRYPTANGGEGIDLPVDHW